MILLPQTKEQGGFTIDFPLDTAQLLKLAADISDEIGIYTSPKITLKATVQTHVQTATEQLTLPFVHTIELKPSGSTLEWDSNLSLYKDGYWEGLIYEHQGSFGYTIQFKPNILYGPIVIKSAPPPNRHQELEVSTSYPAASIDTLEVTLHHTLDATGSTSSIENEVEVTATLGKSGGSEQTFVLLPMSQRAGNFSVTFPVNIALFYSIIQDMPQEVTGSPSAYTYNLSIRAAVHTTAQSQFGQIDEYVTPSLTASLEPTLLTWGRGNNTVAKGGAIKETLNVFQPDRLATRVVSTGAFLVMSMLCFFTARSYIQTTRFRPSSVEAEAIKAKKRHKDIIVDVDNLPQTRAEDLQLLPIPNGGFVVSVGSLEELVKLADSLLKPVLHKVEIGKHIYWVIDDLTRYEYVSTLKPPDKDDEN